MNANRGGKQNSVQENRSPQIGEVYLMHFDGFGNEQQGWRPGLILQNNAGNKFSPNIIALPFTSALKKTNQPTHVIIPANETGLRMDSMVLCENPKCISKSKLGKLLTKLPDKYMKEVAIGYLIATSAISFIDPVSLISAWQKAIQLNTAA